MADVTMSGETRLFTRTTGEMGYEAGFNFCPRCGTSLWWGGDTEGEGPLVGHYGIAGGCFADADLPPPMLSVYERTKHPWISTPEETLCFSAMPEDPAVWIEVAKAMQREP